MSKFLYAVVVLLATTAAAIASADEPATAAAQPEYGVMPMASEGSDRRLERRLSQQGRPKHDRRQTGPGGILELRGGVPIFVGGDINRSVVRPGGSFGFLGGVDFGYAVAEIEAGYMAVPMDLASGERQPLQRINLSFGPRLQVPNNSPWLPYLSAHFATQWWKLDTRTGCGLVACSTGNAFRFAPGLSLRIGTTISLCASTAIDIGFGYNLSFQGDGVFTQTRQWIEPTIGFRFWI